MRTEAFPNDQLILKDISDTILTLHALFLENRNRIQAANEKWKNVSVSSKHKEEHIYINQIMIDQRLSENKRPITTKTTLIVSGYLSWKKEWEKALKVLKTGEQSNEVLLEEIRLNLLLGNYPKAKRLLSDTIPKSKEEKLIKEVLNFWHLSLTGNATAASKILTRIGSDYLYSPQFNFYSYENELNPNKKIQIYKKALTRFPSNNLIFENLIKNLLQISKYCEIQYLLEIQEKIYHVEIAPIFYENIKDKCTHRIDSEFTNSFESLNWRAGKAINMKRYDLLEKYASALMQHYPQYLDGKLYMSEYYKKTGQITRYNNLLKRIKNQNK